ncbi:DUF6185 family protein [Streptomyces sp. NPDC091682]|uniref:DUF6185 family protein n=1 Tax=Streptomyces sp. NPDC091682 TaxID=3366005 RepID=UPI00381AB9F3
MIRPCCSAPRLLYVLFLVLCLTLPEAGRARAAEGAPTDCRADQLKKTKVTALAEFKHRGNDFSMLTSTMDVSVPADWRHASALLLDAHASAYRFALACLVGKPPGEQNDFRDDEWRFKPVTVKADGQWVKVHYKAATWVQNTSLVAVGSWRLTVTKDNWRIELRPTPALKDANWEKVHVSLGGPGALTADPPPAFGEGGTRLSWRHEQHDDYPTVTFRPPAAQHWDYITTTSEGTWQAWEAWGYYGASSAFWYVATGGLLLVAGRRLRLSLSGKLMPQESKAMQFLRWWAVLLMFLGSLIYLGDNLYLVLHRLMGWKDDYSPTLAVFALAFLGLSLCLLGSLPKHLRVGVCALVLGLTGAYVVSEVNDFTLLPTADQLLSPPGWTGAMACAALMAVGWLGVISVGQRILLMGEARLPAWVMVCVAVVAAMMTVLWSYLAFARHWDRVSWLADPNWPAYNTLWATTLDGWWWAFPVIVADPLLTIVSLLAPLPLLGVLRVCRVEQYEKGAFTPDRAEKFLLAVLFAVTFAPQGYYYGFSAYALSLLLCLCTAWGVIALGSSVSVLEKSSADNAPLGRVISRTDRADVLRLARRFRELQTQLHRLSTAKPAERSTEQGSIEAEIDRLDQSLPEGVRPADLPFAFGPMSTWWGNARRGAVDACLVGLPVTGLLYWTSAVKGDSWTVTTQDPAGFLLIMIEILYWQVAWIVGGFFLGALWRDLPGRHGPAKAMFVALVFAVPAAADFLIAQALGGNVPRMIGEIAAFGSVMTCTGLVMDLQTFQDERRYWPTNASLAAYVYQMRFASVAFFLAQLLALATLWKTLADMGPSAPNR